MSAFTMPSLGADMEDGILVEWMKKQGDEVRRGDIVAVVETEKGAIEIEIFEDGKIEKILVAEGRKVPVGTPLATILGTDETPETSPVEEQRIPEKTSPTARPEVAIEPEPAPPLRDHDSGILASPAARQYAREHHIPLAKIAGSGPEGAIQLCDFEGTTAKSKKRTIDLDAMRHAIAAAMSRSKREIPHYYMTHRIDVGGVQNWLESYNAEHSPPERLLFGALLLKATSLAVIDFPEFNGHFDADSFTASQAVHAGMAITIRGGGLVAPAIRNSDKLTLPELMVRMRDLIGRVRQGSFRASELTSSTITVNSLGERGVEGVFPIIYPPQVAIVGFGKIEDRPWVVDNEITRRPILHMTLAADHRVSDGHRGGLFVRAIADRLDEPEFL